MHGLGRIYAFAELSGDARFLRIRPSTEALVAQRKSRDRGRFQTRMRRCNFGTALRLMPGSASGDLRIEVDGLGLPLLIKGAIFSRHR
jgi:hypothetical protein